MKFKIVLLFLIIIIMASAFGCSNKEKKSGTDIPDSKAVSQAEPNSTESTGAAFGSTDSGINESQDLPQSITVISKSDSTITQAEKKKVLDDLSAEVDSLINEVNQDNSSEGNLE